MNDIAKIAVDAVNALRAAPVAAADTADATTDAPDADAPDADALPTDPVAAALPTDPAAAADALPTSPADALPTSPAAAAAAGASASANGAGADTNGACVTFRFVYARNYNRLVNVETANETHYSVIDQAGTKLGTTKLDVRPSVTLNVYEKTLNECYLVMVTVSVDTDTDRTGVASPTRMQIHSIWITSPDISKNNTDIRVSITPGCGVEKTNTNTMTGTYRGTSLPTGPMETGLLDAAVRGDIAQLLDHIQTRVYPKAKYDQLVQEIDGMYKKVEEKLQNIRPNPSSAFSALPNGPTPPTAASTETVADLQAKVNALQDELQRARTDHETALNQQKLRWLESEAKLAVNEIEIEKVRKAMPGVSEAGTQDHLLLLESRSMLAIKELLLQQIQQKESDCDEKHRHLEAELKRIRQEKEDSDAAQNTVTAKLGESIAKHAQGMAEKERINAQLTQQIAELTRENESLAKYQKTILRLQEEFQINEIARAATRAINSLNRPGPDQATPEASEDAAAAALATRDAEFARLEGEAQPTKKRAQYLETDVDALKRRKVELDTNTSALGTEIERLTREKEEAEKEVTDLEARNTALSEELARITEEKASITKELAGIQQESADLQAQEAALQPDIETLKQALAEKLKQLSADRAQLEEQVAAERAEYNELQSQSSELESTNAQLKEQLTTLDASISDFKQNFQKMQRENAVFTTRIKQRTDGAQKDIMNKLSDYYSGIALNHVVDVLLPPSISSRDAGRSAPGTPPGTPPSPAGKQRGGGTPYEDLVRLFKTRLTENSRIPFYKMNALSISSIQSLVDKFDVNDTPIINIIYGLSFIDVTRIVTDTTKEQLENFIKTITSKITVPDNNTEYSSILTNILKGNEILSEIIKEYTAKDTERANALFEAFNSTQQAGRQYVHIFHLMDAISTLFTTTGDTGNLTKHLSVLQKLYDTAVNGLETLANQKNSKILKETSTKPGYSTETESPLSREVGHLIKAQNDTHILTFIKLNNPTVTDVKNKRSEYNERYQLALSNEPTDNGFVKVTHNRSIDAQNRAWYRDDGTRKQMEYYASSAGSRKRMTNIHTYYHNVDASNVSQYLYGPFTGIFLPDQTNVEILNTKYIQNIIQQAISGRPVFLIGYGASGAGKTSSMIYLNKQVVDRQTGQILDQTGIMTHICNKLGKTYGGLQLSVREFYATYDGSCPDSSGNYGCDISPIDFTFDEKKGFISSSEYTPTKRHTYRSEHGYKYDDEDPHKNTLGYIMAYLVDRDRLVKATTNNPNSSRSHVIVHLKLTSTGTSQTKPVHLFIGDFSGVENVFNCEDLETRRQFINIKRDEILAPGSIPRPYYSTEPNIENKRDPIHGGAGAITSKPDPNVRLSMIEFLNNLAQTQIATSQELTVWSKSNAIHMKEVPIYDFALNRVTEKYPYPQHLDYYQLCDTNSTVLTRIINTLIGITPKTRTTNFYRQEMNTITENAVNLLMRLSDKYASKDNYYNYLKTTVLFGIIDPFDINTIWEGLQHANFDQVMKPAVTENLRYLFTNQYKVINDNKRYPDIKYLEDYTNSLGVNQTNNDKFWIQSEQIQRIGLKQHVSFVFASAEAEAATKVPTDGKEINKLVRDQNQYILHKYFDFKDYDAYINEFGTLVNKVKNAPIAVQRAKFIETFRDRSAFYFPHKMMGINVVGENEIPYIVVLPKTLGEYDLNLAKDQRELFGKLKMMDATIDVINTELIKSDEKTKLIPKREWETDLLPPTKCMTVNTTNSIPLANYFGTTVGEEGFDSYHEKYMYIGSLVLSVYLLMEYIRTSLDEIKPICDHRVIEGEFINKTLGDLRTNIHTIMSVKHKDILFYSPDYVNECLPSYGSMDAVHSFQFKERVISDPPAFESILVEWVYTQYSGISQASSYDKTRMEDSGTSQASSYDKTSMEAFYRDLIVGIFCVFNISRKANNPPSILYLDIQALKHAHYRARDVKKVLPALEQLHSLLTNIKTLDYNILRSVDQKIITTLTEVYEKIKKYPSEYVQKFGDNVNILIHLIETHNAATPLGTLEWTDSISKLNTVDTVCYDYTRPLIPLEHKDTEQVEPSSARKSTAKTTKRNRGQSILKPVLGARANTP